MKNSMISFATIILMVNIIIVLFATHNWRRENSQPTYLESFKGNIKVFREMLNLPSSTKEYFPMRRVRIFASHCTTVVNLISFFLMGNHGPNPCDIDHIKLSDTIMDHTLITNSKELR